MTTADAITAFILLTQPLSPRVTYCNNVTITPAHMRNMCEPVIDWLTGPGNCTVCTRHKRYDWD